jgi:hypothetical protein
MKDNRSKKQQQNRRDMILVGVLVLVCILLYVVSIFITPDIRQLSLGGFGEGAGGGEAAKASTTTPRPTATLQPTRTPTTKPSATSRPQNNPTQKSSQDSAAQGIGVSRSSVQAQYEARGFAFSENGTENSTGKVSDQSAAVSLIGPAENLTRTMIVVHLPPEKRLILARNLTYVSTMIKTVLPQWKEGSAWLYASIGKMASMPEGARTEEKVFENVRLRLKMVNQPDLLTLICEEKQP